MDGQMASDGRNDRFGFLMLPVSQNQPSLITEALVRLLIPHLVA